MPIYSIIGSTLEGPGGILPYRSDGSARRKISRKPPKGTRILFYGRVPNSFPSLRDTRTAILILIKITFEHFLFKDVLKVLS